MDAKPFLPFLVLLPVLTGFVVGEAKATDFIIESPAFRDGRSIPSRYTCDGDDISPELRWRGVPEGTRSLALIVDDPDAPDPAAPRMVWAHWVLYAIAPQSSGLPEGVATLPSGVEEGINDWKRTGYRGPCPPVGRHRYFFTLYALDFELPDLGNPTREVLREAMKGHVLGRAVLMGTYAHPN